MWHKEVIYWELYHEQEVKYKEYNVHCVYIIHFIQFFYQANNMCLYFSND